MSRADRLVASPAFEIGAAVAEVTLGVFTAEERDEKVVEFRADPFERCPFPNQSGSEQPKGCGVKEVRVHRRTEFERVRGEKSFP